MCLCVRMLGMAFIHTVLLHRRNHLSMLGWSLNGKAFFLVFRFPFFFLFFSALIVDEMLLLLTFLKCFKKKKKLCSFVHFDFGVIYLIQIYPVHTMMKPACWNFLCTWISAQVPKCLIIILKSLKMKIVHTVTKGKRHSAGCIFEEKKIIQRLVWMSEWEEYRKDGWMFLNKRLTMMKKRKEKRTVVCRMSNVLR